jgi:hypothetical protein
MGTGTVERLHRRSRHRGAFLQNSQEETKVMGTSGLGSHQVWKEREDGLGAIPGEIGGFDLGPAACPGRKEFQGGGYASSPIRDRFVPNVSGQLHLQPFAPLILRQTE